MEIYDYEESLIAKTAWYYYSENLTQQNISELLGISRMRVIKLLEKAKSTGIIQFRIRSNVDKRMQLEQNLIRKFALKDCFIVPSPTNSQDTNENVARAAAMYISNRINADCFINIGYGDTTGRILNHLAINTEYTLSFVSLTGGVSYYLPNARSSTFNSKLYLMPSPLIISTKEMANAIKAEKSVKEVEQLIPSSHLSVVGIGAMDQRATILQSGILSQNEFLILENNGAVGDLLSHFIDQNGEIVNSSLEERTVSTTLDAIRKLENVIGVAAGEKKVKAIRSVLNGHFLDVFITDEETASYLVNENNEN